MWRICRFVLKNEIKAKIGGPLPLPAELGPQCFGQLTIVSELGRL
jgi:hypothetical protein